MKCPVKMFQDVHDGLGGNAPAVRIDSLLAGFGKLARQRLLKRKPNGFGIRLAVQYRVCSQTPPLARTDIYGRNPNAGTSIIPLEEFPTTAAAMETALR